MTTNNTNFAEENFEGDQNDQVFYCADDDVMLNQWNGQMISDSLLENVNNKQGTEDGDLMKGTLCTDPYSEYGRACLELYQPIVNFVTPQEDQLLAPIYRESNEMVDEFHNMKQEEMKILFVKTENLTDNFANIYLKSPSKDNNSNFSTKKTRIYHKNIPIRKPRSKKEDMLNMTKMQRKEMKKVSNRVNTINYYNRKKKDLKEATKVKNDLKHELLERRRLLENSDEYLHTAREMINCIENNETRGSNTVQVHLEFYCRDTAKIKENALTEKRFDSNLYNLQTDLREKEAAFASISNDANLRLQKANTQGSRKWRAKQAFIRSMLNYDIDAFQFDLEEQNRLEDSMEQCKRAIAPFYSNAVNQKQPEYWIIRFEKYDEIQEFFGHHQLV